MNLPSAFTSAPSMNSAPAPAPMPAPPAPPQAAPAPAPRAPWWQEGCPACAENKILGFSSAGSPCSICDQLAGERQRPASAAFDVQVSTSSASWKPKDKWADTMKQWAPHLPAPIEATVPVAGNAPKSETREQLPPPPMPIPAMAPPQPAPMPTPAPEPAPSTQPAPQVVSLPQPGTMPQAQAPAAFTQPPTPTTTPAQAARLPGPNAGSTAPAPAFAKQIVEAVLAGLSKRGRPAKGFTLYLGCAPVGAKVVRLEQVYSRLISEFSSQQAQGQRFGDLPIAQKQAFLESATLVLANEWGKDDVVAPLAPNDNDWGMFLQLVTAGAASIVAAHTQCASIPHQDVVTMPEPDKTNG